VASNSNLPLSRTQTPVENNRSRQQRLNKQQVNNKILEQQKSEKKEDRYSKTTEIVNNSLKKKSQKGTKLDTTVLPMGESRAQSREIAKLQTELGMSPEEIVELISDGKRKSQRRCVSNRPKNIELWSSDEYEEFQSTKDIIALIEEKEKRNVKRRKESQASSRKSSISRSGDRSTTKYVVEDEKSRQDLLNNSEIQTTKKISNCGKRKSCKKSKKSTGSSFQR